MEALKSYNHLFEQLLSDELIEKAIYKASKGKKDRPRVKKYLEMPDLVSFIKDYVLHYKNAPHRPIQIYDGITRKKRTIVVPTFPELVVQHMIVMVMEPIFMKGMYVHSYGSIPKRGSIKGKQTIEKWIRTDGENCNYCLKMDIKKYFDSVQHDKLLLKLRKLIHDERFFNLLKKIVAVNEVGIPLGFYLSQWLANWYLQDLDHYIKENLLAKYYIRYMDDMVVFDKDKNKLHFIRHLIELYLNIVLGLEMKGNWQVFLFDIKENGRALDFMGFKFYRDRTVIRWKILLRALRKTKKISKEKRPTVFEIRQLLSYMGWFKHTDTYKVFGLQVNNVVDINEYKKRVSYFDRRAL